ncbi:MAG: hypothetical protein LUG98_03390 [Tannerellaceae bacterium]|nr:hypothetical protein [Tannerellaceae bacterium]
MKVRTVVENALSKALKEYCSDTSMHLTSDLFVQVDNKTGELQLFDESEALLLKEVVFDWVDSPEETFYRDITPLLKEVFASIASTDLFEHSSFIKPFSVSLTDEEFQVVEELFFLDDDMFRLDDPLLKGLDEELNKFLEDLLSDVK